MPPPLPVQQLMPSGERKPIFFQRFSDDSLRAQVEAGNITVADIEVLQQVEDRMKFYKDVGLFGAAAVTAWYGRLYRKPPWSLWRTFGLSTMGGMAGLGLASVVSVGVVIRAADKLENQERFKAAVKALKEDAAGRPGMRPGPLQRRPPSPLNESGDTADSGASWPDSAATTSNPDSTTYEQPGRSKWDEIRKVQGVTHTSSWDRLREERQKADMKNGPGNATTPRPPPKSGKQPPLSDSERELTEQERFDALLEAESKEQKGGGSDFSRWN